MWDENRISRWEIKLSHKIKINNKRAIIDSIDPREEIMFHEVYASG
jgi:hypothetical protein